MENSRLLKTECERGRQQKQNHIFVEADVKSKTSVMLPELLDLCRAGAPAVFAILFLQGLLKEIRVLLSKDCLCCCSIR
jgi:hypothetical protein